MSSRINTAISTLQKKVNTSEYRGFKYKGARLSNADAEVIIMYLKRFLSEGSFFGLMEPCGGVKKVLDQLV